MGSVVKVGGAAVVFLFAIFWLVLSWQVLTHTGTGEVSVGSNINIIAGGLATAVGTSTAAWLGIEIKKIKDQQVQLQSSAPNSNPDGWGKRLKTVLTRADVVSISCWTYLVIAIIVLLLAAFKQDAAPDMYEAFMLSGFGWLLGAFAAQAPPSQTRIRR